MFRERAKSDLRKNLAYRGGTWAWLFQRITGVLLIVCLAIHLFYTHILNIGEINSANIAARLASIGITIVDIVMLASAVFHALNGIRMVLLDYWFTSHKKAMTLSITLWLVGIIVFIYGIWALWPWIT